MKELLLQVKKLRVEFGQHVAVCDVDLNVHAGETLGLVGESGSGKSSLARGILRLIEIAGGTVGWCGEDLGACSPARLRELRRDMQIVFQNPTASLNPRMTIEAAVAEPLVIFEPRLDASARRSKIIAMLEGVGLDGGMLARYPHELSGGQCQRVAIARAMILMPKLLVCDEPVSSLDVSIQGQIVNLLADLQAQFGIAMLFISHNLSVVRHLSERIMVLYRGRCIELAARDDLFAQPLHPYTRALLAAASGPSGAGWPMQAAPVQAAPVPGLGDAGAGCIYRNRCNFALDICRAVDPPLLAVGPRHFAACHRASEFRNAGHVA